METQKPSIGRIVHYVLPSGRNAGEHRPAIIVKIWGDQPGAAVQLQVFTDSDPAGSNNDMIPNPSWRTSVMEDPMAEKPGTWHWPEREG